MGIGDKIQNKAQEVGGDQRGRGGRHGQRAFQAEGVADQAGAKAKQAGEASQGRRQGRR